MNDDNTIFHLELEKFLIQLQHKIITMVQFTKQIILSTYMKLIEQSKFIDIIYIWKFETLPDCSDASHIALRCSFYHLQSNSCNLKDFLQFKNDNIRNSFWYTIQYIVWKTSMQMVRASVLVSLLSAGAWQAWDVKDRDRRHAQPALSSAYAMLWSKDFSCRNLNFPPFFKQNKILKNSWPWMCNILQYLQVVCKQNF